jgi:hypothetical protein
MKVWRSYLPVFLTATTKVPLRLANDEFGHLPLSDGRKKIKLERDYIRYKGKLIKLL